MTQDKDKLKEVGLEPDKPRGYIRGIWAITLILAFSLIVGGGVYFILWCSPWGETVSWHRQGTVDETKDWQTYSNSTYDFLIKYPKDWQYAEFPTSLASGSFISVSFYDKDLSADIEKLKANPETELVYDVALTILEGDRKSEYSSESSCEKPSDTKIGGVSAELYKCRNQMVDKDSFNYVVVNNNKTYSLAAFEENKETLDKMIKTVDFDKATTSSSPSPAIQYQLYTNNTYKFSFDYPADTKLSPGQSTAVIELESGKITQFSYGERTSFDIRSEDNYTHTPTIEKYLTAGGKELSKYTKFTVAGETAYKYTDNSANLDLVYFMHSDRIFIISQNFGEYGASRETATAEVFEKILTSFKFL
ncbi:hypothetical protein KJ713_00515 [Patescibacteria group bacterium]|nr:hypothetical protein [Patescibacteria group bacterium]